jgi:hypothetical protein
MKIGKYTVLEHTETVSPYRFVVFQLVNGRSERVKAIGKRGGFRTLNEACLAATKLAGEPMINWRLVPGLFNQIPRE